MYLCDNCSLLEKNGYICWSLYFVKENGMEFYNSILIVYHYLLFYNLDVDLNLTGYLVWPTNTYRWLK